MKNSIALLAITLCLFLSSCHRPVAYFQRTPRPAPATLSIEKPVVSVDVVVLDSVGKHEPIPTEAVAPVASIVATTSRQPAQMTARQVTERMHRMQSMVAGPVTEKNQQQPEPKPKKKLKLGNQIRQGLGMRLRPELNWWQRISWKLKASVLVILVAVVFAILHITILAIIFGVLGALLLMSGLKRSFKVKRPWF